MSDEVHNIETPMYSRDNLPNFSGAKKYRKKVLTRAIRIVGEFKVDTGQGIATCKDGYLALDARGYPFPIAKEEFEKIYVETSKGDLFK